MACLCRCWAGILLGLLIPTASLAGQDILKDTLQGIYDQTLTAMRTAKTSAEIQQIVSHIDMAKQTRIGPDGHVGTAMIEQTIHELESVIAQPKRSIWKIDILWVSRVQDEATSVAWIYTKSDSADAEGAGTGKVAGHPALFGTLIRDKWVLTKDGWRRGSHEKLFPDRVLAIGGNDIIPPE